MHESTIELTKISRILMSVDQGEVHQYVGKHLPALDEDKVQSDISEEEEAQSDQEIDGGRAINQNINAMAVNKLKTKKIKIQKKIKVVTEILESTKLNVIDTFSIINSTIRSSKDEVNNLIGASKMFAASLHVNADEDFNRHHRQKV
ncbi:unnamed protein product [Psylliodes chrysocephalus]|uniref:Uncharacterized protein n=1 Tax=Psylliodes chrysocephalus TaxID=3402493 RepID=A0A9P0DA40_9CUCU|nr:unnamed protein product [Psylliodes chrysocephala]